MLNLIFNFSISQCLVLSIFMLVSSQFSVRSQTFGHDNVPVLMLHCVTDQYAHPAPHPDLEVARADRR